MQAIVKSEESTVVAPKLQLFTRSGGLMANIISGSYVIQKMSANYTVAPTEQVASQAINIVTHKLGTGRYAVLSTDTSAWDIGSYQIVASLILELGGGTVTYVIPFELLDPIVYALGSGPSWRGYARTAHLLREGYIGSAVPVGRIQATIQRISRKIEEWTLGRIFEHRYMTIKVNGQQQHHLMVPQSIIAIDQIVAVSIDAGGAEQTSTYDSTAFTVFNRHMDGLLSPDDRFNPLITLTNAYPSPTLIDTWSWPHGRQNLHISGLFGYVDPDIEAAPTGFAIGHQSEEIEHVAGVLAARQIADPAMMGGPSVHNPGLVKKYTTRHQSIEFFGASGTVSYAAGMSGDPLIDAILAQYAMAPTPIYAERDPYYDWPVE